MYLFSYTKVIAGQPIRFLNSANEYYSHIIEDLLAQLGNKNKPTVAVLCPKGMWQ